MSPLNIRFQSTKNFWMDIQKILRNLQRKKLKYWHCELIGLKIIIILKLKSKTFLNQTNYSIQQISVGNIHILFCLITRTNQNLKCNHRILWLWDHYFKNLPVHAVTKEFWKDVPFKKCLWVKIIDYFVSAQGQIF